MPSYHLPLERKLGKEVPTPAPGSCVSLDPWCSAEAGCRKWVEGGGQAMPRETSLEPTAWTSRRVQLFLYSEDSLPEYTACSVCILEPLLGLLNQLGLGQVLVPTQRAVNRFVRLYQPRGTTDMTILRERYSDVGSTGSVDPDVGSTPLTLLSHYQREPQFLYPGF